MKRITAATVAVLLTSVPVAHAQSSLVEDVTRSSVVSSSQDVLSSGALLEGVLSSYSLSSSSSLPDAILEIPENYPYPVDESITSVELVSREVRDAEAPIERWGVASPSMGRVIYVDIRLPEAEAAPIVVMLDGVGARLRSGWLHGDGGAETQKVFGEENATLVFPLDANGTWYADWVNDDPQLGRHKWETFITAELLPLVEAQPEVYFNGNRAIGGLSMGASAAIHIANQHPDLFTGAFGISGCYSPTSPEGRRIAEIVPLSRGANPENMWGPYGSPEWHRHDVVADPSGLRDTRVYLSTATGATYGIPSPEEQDTGGLVSGVLLERGTHNCTRDLDRALAAMGKQNYRVDYKDEGRHRWDNFAAQLAPAWEYVRPAMYN